MRARLPLVSPVDRALFLKAQAYLEGVSPSVLAALASYTEERFYKAGEMLRDEGTSIDRIAFLGQGTVEVFGMNGLAGASRQIEAPGAIGLAHHFTRDRSAPAVRAASDALCLEIRTDDLDQILEDHFSLLMQMARSSCQHAVLTIQELGVARPPIVGFAETLRDRTPIQLDLVARLARLKQVPFWSDANLGILAELVRQEPPRFVGEGEMVWREGDPINQMVVVLDGRFRSRGRYGEVEAPSGATLGGWELFIDGSRFESWIADVPSRIIPIRRDLFIDLLEDHFEFSQAFLARVSDYIVEGWRCMEEQGVSDH